jgi:hypothetical protein
MSLLMLPLSGAFLLLSLAVLAVKIFALVDAATRPAPAFPSTGKQSKQFWLVVLAVALLTSVLGFLSILGLVAAIIYLVDVRPAVRDVPRGGSTHTGPYGPW